MPMIDNPAVNDPATIAFAPRPERDGPERLVNTATAGNQVQPVIASLPSGGFVVCWVSLDGFGKSIRAQIFDASGAPVGGEIIFVAASELFHEPCIAALPNGEFVICWTGPVGGVFGSDIYGQRFDAAGARIGLPFLVNGDLVPHQFQPSIATLASGGFVVTWTESSSGFLSVRAQIFDDLAAKVGSELLVGATLEAGHNLSSVTALASGGFVVSWRETAGIRVGGGIGLGGITFVGGDGSGSAVIAQVYDGSGATVGGEFVVSTTTSGDQTLPRLTALAGGGFVAIWQDASGIGGDASVSAVKGQLFDGSGARIGAEFLVNSSTANGQTEPAVTSLSWGGFVVSWTDASGQGGDASGTGIKAQAFDALGTKVGAESLVNGATLNGQSDPSLATLSSGEVVAVWTDNSGQGGDGAGSGIKAQILGPVATEQVLYDLKGVILVEDVDASPTDGILVTLSVDYGILVVNPASLDILVGANGTDTVSLAGNLSDIQALLGGGPGAIAFLANSDDPPAGVELSVSVSDGANVTSASLDIAITPVADAPTATDVTLNIERNTTHVFTLADFGFDDPDGDALSRVAFYDMASDGKLMVDVDGPGGNEAVSVQPFGPGNPAMITREVIEAGGLFFFPEANEGGTGYAQFRFAVESDGEAPNLSSQQLFTFNVNNAPTVSIQGLPRVKAGGEILVNSATAGNQFEQQIAAQADGSFAIVWLDESDGVGGAGGDTIGGAIKFQLFDALGVPVDGEVLVNSAVEGVQESPLIAALEGGFYVVTWVDWSEGEGGATGDSSGAAVKAQLLDAAGLPVGDEILVNQATTGDQEPEAVIGLEGGGFAIVWRDSSQGIGGATGDASGFAIKARVYDASGDPLGGEFLVNSAVLNAQIDAQAAALPGTGFVVTWTDSSQGVGGAGGDTSFGAIKAQLFDTNGVRIGGERLVNTYTISPQVESKVTALANGGFVISWVDRSGTSPGDPSANAVKAQVFDSDGDKVGGEIAVNGATAGSQERQQIAALEGGGFVIVWQDPSAGVGGATGDSSSLAVKAQLFDDLGNLVGGEILVNTATASFQYSPQILALADGSFVVAWNDGSQSVGGATGDSSMRAVKAQLFAASGARIGGELLVNSATENWQVDPRLAALPDGGFVVIWEDESEGVGGATGDTDFRAVKAQIFRPQLEAIEQVPLDLKGTIVIADEDGPGPCTVTLSVDYGVLTVAAGTSRAAVSGSGTSSVTVTGTLSGIQALLGGDPASLVHFVANSDDPPAGATLTLTVDDGAGGTAVAAETIVLHAVNDAPVNSLPATLIGIEDEPILFAGGIFIDPPPVLVADADSGTISVRLTVADGTLSPLASGAATITGNNSNDITISGTVADVNLAVYLMVYTPAPDANGPRTIIVTTSDGALSDVDTISVDILAINEAPSGDDFVRIVAAGGRYQIQAGDFGFSDLHDGNALLSVELVSLPAHGRLINVNGFNDDLDVTGDGVPDIVVRRFVYEEGDSISAADLLAGLVYYEPEADVSGIGADSFDFRVRDDGGTAWGGIDLDPGANRLTFDVIAPAIANDDAGDTSEDLAIVGASLFGNDVPPTGLALAVEEVNGLAANVGAELVLASGAKLIVNSDGTYSYDPNGRFNTLTSTSTGQVGAVNTSATDSFTYKLVNGDTATVTITVEGVGSPEDRLEGDGGNNIISGTPNVDIFQLQQGGEDSAQGLESNDGFYFGDELSAGDVVDGAGANNDQLIIQGDYSSLYTFGESNMVNVEVLAILRGADTRFGDPGTNLYDYNLATVDANVAAGRRLTVDFAGLAVGEDVVFDGSAETDGGFTFYAGKGDDHLIGGAGADLFVFRSDGRFTGADRVDGRGGNDELALRGDYAGANAVTFSATTMTDIEVLVILSGQNSSWGRFAGEFDYDVTTNDANVAAGRRLTVDAAQLLANESLVFDGSAETDGTFRIFGGKSSDTLIAGAGNDTICAGLGADTLTGGGGADLFVYKTALDSTLASADTILDYSSTLGDRIDLSKIDAKTGGTSSDAFAFIGSAAFSGTGAASQGQLRAEDLGGGIWQVQGDVDGDGAADLHFFVTVADGDPILASDFFL